MAWASVSVVSRETSCLFGVVLCLLVFVLDNVHYVQGQAAVSSQKGGTPCYDAFGKPQRCIPPFENAAFIAEVESTNTCGFDESGAPNPTNFCVQSGTHVTRKTCDTCYEDTHPVRYLTDLTNTTTWWQSTTMLDNVQYPTQVNITLKFGKTYDVTYVRLLFWSPRPESFAIYRKTYENSSWTPYQFYSGSCRDTYGLPDDNSGTLNDSDTRIFCTSEYSDISPLTGGAVPFSTLEGRARANHFDTNNNLQEFVTSTEIRVTLDRLNTFGDELFNDPQVLKSYFYAIADISVGARCRCNGHASECPVTRSYDGIVRRVCKCDHKTAGPDCNECLPFYNDAPWKRASISGAHECQACNCNGFSNRCFFDKELYNRTGHGGHCLDCQGDRDGPNCERCRDNYYQRADDIYCTPCNCDSVGSVHLQCNSQGRCQCKPGVTGDKCDRCDVNYYNFGDTGCTPCDCYPSGSLHNTPKCDSVTGLCECKDNVEGAKCQNCKPGYFNLDAENEFGCTKCFCYGHSSVCRSAPGYSKVMIETYFSRSTEKWSATDITGKPVSPHYNALIQSLELTAPGHEPMYFSASARFLGDQRASYNHDLIFKLKIGNENPRPSNADIVLEGANLQIQQTIIGQGQPIPSTKNQEFVFRLHEHPDYGWQPKLSPQNFISVLANLTAIKIRATYAQNGVGFLDDVKLETARRGAAGSPAQWIESCNCSTGYVGQFCESCAPGYRHEPTSGGPFSPCVPCNCNGHADICDAETGRCICQDNTGGDNCERCARGYYGDSLLGTTGDCKQCPCPNQGPCMQVGDDSVVCLECPRGYGGSRCDLCSDGYYGKAEPGGKLVCLPCECNGNVDVNAVGNCNTTTGECIKCIYNTGGVQCDSCLSGYYGEPLALPKGDCKPCLCYTPGTLETENFTPVCDQLTGQCGCKPHVVGTNCDQCEVGHFNIRSGQGCQSCNCDPIGSVNRTCDPLTGQCVCRPGVTGTQCQLCQSYHYGFSLDGCKPCNCDQIGSTSLQCDPSGQCPCLDNVEGIHCDRCKENKHNRQRGCEPCPYCYNLVADAVAAHRSNLNDLNSLLNNITNSPIVIDDAEFEKKLHEVVSRVEGLWENAKQGTAGGEKNLAVRLEELRSRIKAASDSIAESGKWNQAAEGAVQFAAHNVTLAENTIQKLLSSIQDAMDILKTDGAQALHQAVEKSKKLGMQSKQMSDIAKEARSIVEQQRQDLNTIRDQANQALNRSTMAHELTMEALNTQKNTSNDLRALESDLMLTSQNLDQTLGAAQDAKQRVNATEKEALAVFRDIYAVSVPDVKPDIIKANALGASKEADRIKQLAQNLLKDHAPELKSLEELLESSEDLLAKGVVQQDIAQAMYADAEGAYHKATEAVELGEKTLREAKQTYDILKEFDKQVQDSKDKATSALDTIPSINDLIVDAQGKTKAARQNLAGAEVNAQLAKTVAQEAQTKYAEQASKEADMIKKSADETKSEAISLNGEANTLANKVAETEAKMEALENQASQDQKLTNQAKNKIGQAKTSASEASKQVQKALEEVNKIVDELNDLADIDDNTLTSLEERLRVAENEFYNANLDIQLETLSLARIQQAQQVKNYQEELNRLQGDVKNLEAIRDSLPHKCFKRTKIEL
uniref:Laminin subunit gamma-1 n=1 Tax=Cacopsylla melanoneura TaxID=428564 RepID=A0A8D9B170_9HEMI